MATSIQAKIAPLPRGDYSSSATYAKLDVVSYNGSSYMAIKAVPTGTVPTNTTYWQLLAEKPTIGEGTITTNMLADGAVTADKLDSSVSDKYAEVSGTYEDMVVGSAEQLLSTQYDTDSVPYAFRKSPYGDREFDEIVGGSIAWNQMFDNAGKVINATAGGSTQLSFNTNSWRVRLIAGHKYLLTYKQTATLTSAERNTAMYFDTSWHYQTTATNANLSAGECAWIFTPTSSVSNGDVGIWVVNPDKDVSYTNGNLFDLTQMFGTAVADYIYGLGQTDGVAFFRSLFPKTYYAYNAGELISVSGLSAHKMTGFNQWDEEWESGDINSSTGENAVSSASWRSKNFIPVVPSATYYAYSPTASYKTLRPRFYDANKTYIGYSPKSGVTFTDREFTVPDNACYMRFAPNNSDIPNHDVCINISCERNGQYEPYESHSYALDDSLTLCGVPKLDANNELYYDGDVYSSDGSVERRYKQIQITSFIGAWGVMASGNYGVYVSISDYNNSSWLTGATQSNRFFLTTEGRPSAPAYSISLGNGASTSMTFILPSTITSLVEANAWLANNPTWVVYRTTTPTTESASPYVSPQICNEYGTEEYVSAEQSGVTMIVGHNTKYPQNLRKKIEGLPWNFSSLIAPTEVTNKATRNYTVGSFLIMNNTLYKVTSAIANGGTITVGSNVSATTIMQEILAL